MKLSDLSGKKVLILGCGMEGQATLRFLQNVPDISLGLADSKEMSTFSSEAQQLFHNIPESQKHFGDDYLKHFDKYQIVIRTPGISKNLPEIKSAEQAGILFTNATNIFLANVQGKVIGITGTKGKSTTASLLFAVLKKSVKVGVQNLEPLLVGNIGTPALSFLENDSPERLYVYELSSYQLEDCRYSPHIGLITNFFPAHLDHHADQAEYFAAKMNLFRFMKEGDVAIYNFSFLEIAEFLNTLPCRKIPYNDGKESTILNQEIWCQGEKIMNAKEVPLLGKHNLENVLAVIAIAKLFAVPTKVIVEAVQEFRGLEHRLEDVGIFRDIHFYNDSQSTTPDSTIAAIQAFEGELNTLILGGMSNNLDFQKLGETIAESEIPYLIFFPETGKDIWYEVQRACRKIAKDPPLAFFVSNMSECVEKAYEVTESGTICLLSPACQSYNLFMNMQDRGRQFKERVKDAGGEFSQKISNDE